MNDKKYKEILDNIYDYICTCDHSKNINDVICDIRDILKCYLELEIIKEERKLDKD